MFSKINDKVAIFFFKFKIKRIFFDSVTILNSAGYQILFFFFINIYTLYFISVLNEFVISL